MPPFVTKDAIMRWLPTAKAAFLWIRDAMTVASIKADLAKEKADREKLAAENAEFRRAAAATLPVAEFAGWYLDANGLMPNITKFLESVKSNSEAIVIAADFAAYGAISWNECFNSQFELLRALCESGRRRGNRVVMVLNSLEVNNEIIERQYTESVWDQQQVEIGMKCCRWSTSDVFRMLATRDSDEPGSLTKMIRLQARAINRRLFIDAFLEFNERVIEVYREAGAIVKRRRNYVPLHGWFVRKETQSGQRAFEGLLGIVDAQAVWNEPGFWVRQMVAERLMELVQQMAADI